MGRKTRELAHSISITEADTYDIATVLLIVHQASVQPNELLVLSDHRKVVLLEFGQRGLKKRIIIISDCDNGLARPTLVCTVNLTLSRSLNASEMSTTSEVSDRSIVSLRGCNRQKDDQMVKRWNSKIENWS